MKHIKKMTVAKADVLEDVTGWFEDAWETVSEFFKGLFGG